MILIIEDRVERQFRLLNLSNIVLDTYHFVENAKLAKYNKVYEALEKESFDFSRYEFIISHENAFNKNPSIIERLKKGCENSNIPLVLFTGNQGSTYYNRDSQYAHINSKLLYSQNLKLFLDDVKKSKEPNIDILLYGEKWLLNIALNTLEKIDIFIEKNEKDKIFYKRFLDRFKDDLNYLKNNEINIYEPNSTEKFIQRGEIEKIIISLKTSIQKIIDG